MGRRPGRKITRRQIRPTVSFPSHGTTPRRRHTRLFRQLLEGRSAQDQPAPRTGRSPLDGPGLPRLAGPGGAGPRLPRRRAGRPADRCHPARTAGRPPEPGQDHDVLAVPDRAPRLGRLPAGGPPGRRLRSRGQHRRRLYVRGPRLPAVRTRQEGARDDDAVQGVALARGAAGADAGQRGPVPGQGLPGALSGRRMSREPDVRPHKDVRRWNAEGSLTTSAVREPSTASGPATCRASRPAVPEPAAPAESARSPAPAGTWGC